MNAILRPAEQRGHANHGWLDTYHSFSFVHYFDSEHAECLLFDFA